MNAATLGTHPSADELTSFALGQLDDAAERDVALHLDACPDCQHQVAAVPADAFVTLLRSARLVEDSQVEAHASLTLSDEPLATINEVRDTPPPELADHPRYRLIRRLGQGGMGTVWLAEHRHMGRCVAVKVIHPEFLRKPNALERFRREVLAASRLHHPNIVTAFDAEQAGTTGLLVMEHVEGVTLDDELRRHGPLPIARACDAVRQAALGLAHAAACGLVHRDLKPHNLMRTPDGVVKILDFGLAALADPESNVGGLTAANVVLGTPDYVAPEQAEGSRNADVRSDVYSLGCTLYHLLAGQVPYPGESVLKKLDGHRAGMPEPLTKVRREVPRGVAAVVAKMMEKDPRRRYQTADEVAAALAPYCHERPERKPPSRSPRVLVGTIFLAGVLLAAGVVIRVQTGQGEVVITTYVPDVEVVLLQGGKEVRVVDTKTTKAVTLPIGEYDVAVKGKPEGVELKTDRVEVRRGKQALVTIERTKTTWSAAPVTPGAAKKDSPKVSGSGEGPEVGPEVGAGSLPVVYPQPKVLWRRKTDDGAILDVAFVPPFGRIVARGPTNAVHWLDPGSGISEVRIKRRVPHLTGLAVARGGSHVATVGEDHAITVVPTNDPKHSRRLASPKAFSRIDLSPDGRFVAGGYVERGWRLWDAATGEAVHDFKGDQVDDLAFAPDGKRVLAAAVNGTYRVWDLDTKKVVSAFGTPHEHRGVPRSERKRLAFSADGKAAYTTSNLHYRQGEPYPVDALCVREWNVATGESRGGWGMRPIVEAFAVSHDGRRLILASAGKPALVQGWNLTEPGGFASFSVPAGVHSMDLNRDGTLLLVGDDDGYVTLYSFPSVSTPALEKTLKEMNAMRDDMIAAQISAKTLKDRNTQLEEHLQNAMRQIAKMKAEGATAAEGRGNNPPAKQVEGVVQKIDGRKVVISMGSDAGLSKGHTLQVFRLGAEASYVGRIKIVEVEAKQAVGETMGQPRKPVQVGDRVASRIVGE